MMDAGAGTLILARDYVARIAAPRDYLDAVEAAFRALAAGAMQSLPVGHVPGSGGAFHAKAAASDHLVAIKVNGNFPGNPERCGLPTIQGCIVLADARNGRLLALIDSIEITARRTAAASAVAGRYLARQEAETIAFIGCGMQAAYHLEAFVDLGWPHLHRIVCFDLQPGRAQELAALAHHRGFDASVASRPREASLGADIVITTTPSQQPIIEADDVAPGCFIAAVGADNPQKCEIAPALMARARVVADIAAQAESMGDLRSAIAAGSMRAADIHADLAQVIDGTRSGRTSRHEIFIFDSTGTAIEDLAAASVVYRRASADPQALRVGLN